MNEILKDILQPILADALVAAGIALLGMLVGFAPKIAKAAIRYFETKTKIDLSDATEAWLVNSAVKIAHEIEERAEAALKGKLKNVTAIDSDQKKVEFVSRLMTAASGKGVALSNQEAEEYLALALPVVRSNKVNGDSGKNSPCPSPATPQA